uniref:Uncharacterized protein n=1 Tax=Arundo donax TaxID=35708 RepID=A0A0A8ZH05_ARUDO
MNLAPIPFSRIFPCIQSQQSRGLMVRVNHNIKTSNQQRHMHV